MLLYKQNHHVISGKAKSHEIKISGCLTDIAGQHLVVAEEEVVVEVELC